MYSRAYFFPSADGKNLDVLMLFTPDEGKGPLVYAIDDLAKEAAKEELLGAGGYRDLGVILGKTSLTGVRVDGPLGRRFLRGLSLTRLWRAQRT